MNIMQQMLPTLIKQLNIKDQEPENNVSKFVNDNFGILFNTNNPDMRPILDVFLNISVMQANQEPQAVLDKLIELNKSFNIFYKGK